MRKSIVLCLLLLSAASQTRAQGATWADNVACLIYTHCTSCHRAGGIAPFSLMTYGDASASASAIQGAVNDRVMPPWPPDKNYRTFAHERVLTQNEIDLINQWVTDGAPSGNLANAPVPPTYNSNEEIPTPDLALQIPVYTLPNVNNDLYQCFVLNTGVGTQKYITGMEIVPGNRSVVHHVLIYQDTTNNCVNLDNNYAGPGYPSFGGTGSSASKLLGVWVPGQGATFYPNGMGVRLPANAKIILQIHYPVGYSGQLDSTKINLRLTSTPLRNINIDPLLNHVTSLTNGPLSIGPNQTKTFYSSYNVPINATVVAVGPHMHLIGRKIKSYGLTPVGDTLKFIDIPEWNFHWQGSYWFRKPLKIPSGTVLKGEAFYDNTSANPWVTNPNQTVSAGESTTEEMMLVYFSWLFYANGDENIIVDTVTVPQYYNGCDIALSRASAQDPFASESVWPQPAGDRLFISAHDGKWQTLVLRDIDGRVVKDISEASVSAGADVSDLSPGIYFLCGENESGKMKRKVIIAR